MAHSPKRPDCCSSWRSAFRRQNWGRSWIRLPWGKCRSSTAISARQCTSRMRMAGEARGGRTTPRRSRRWKRKVPATMTECFELIERELLKGPWVMGEQYTICDPYLFTIGTWIEGDGVDTTRLPRVMDHGKRVLARPAVQKAVAVEGTQIA